MRGNRSGSTGGAVNDSELPLQPSRILVYPRSGALKTMSDHRAEEVLSNLIRALEFLGHQVERLVKRRGTSIRKKWNFGARERSLASGRGRSQSLKFSAVVRLSMEGIVSVSDV